MSPALDEAGVLAAREAYRNLSLYPIVPANHEEALAGAISAYLSRTPTPTATYAEGIEAAAKVADGMANTVAVSGPQAKVIAGAMSQAGASIARQIRALSPPASAQPAQGERAVKGLTKDEDHPLDTCVCGDPRCDHIDGAGPCKHNKPQDMTHGYKDCEHFRLSRRAALQSEEGR